jgi:hypothetical protein
VKTGASLWEGRYFSRQGQVCQRIRGDQHPALYVQKSQAAKGRILLKGAIQVIS